MMTEKKAEIVNTMMINLGILLILVSTTAGKEMSTASFVLGLVLLGIQTLEFGGIEPKKLLTGQVIMAVALAVTAIFQLVAAKSLGTAQVFSILLLVGALLIAVEAVRKYVEQ